MSILSKAYIFGLTVKTKIDNIKFILKSLATNYLEVVFKLLSSCNLTIYKVDTHCLLHEFEKR